MVGRSEPEGAGAGDRSKAAAFRAMADEQEPWISHVIHELRTPLTPLKGFLQTLQRHDEQLSSAERQEIYTILLREEQRLEDLVTSLLPSPADEPTRVIVLDVDEGASLTSVSGTAAGVSPR